MRFNGLRVVIAAGFLVALVYLAILFVAHDFDPDFLAIDSCLDGGGRWEYQLGKCVR